jgi:hypothetical protein
MEKWMSKAFILNQNIVLCFRLTDLRNGNKRLIKRYDIHQQLRK